MTWADAFLWTIALELPLYALVLWRKLRFLPFLGVAIGGSALTHPLVWQLVPRLEIELSSYDRAVWIMEAFAMTVEGALASLVLRRARVDRCVALGFAASLVANAFSWLVGPVLVDWLG